MSVQFIHNKNIKKYPQYCSLLFAILYAFINPEFSTNDKKKKLVLPPLANALRISLSLFQSFD